jgi:hypothetical protein
MLGFLRVYTDNKQSGTVKLPGSDELNGELATYAKFWTQLALVHSTNARLGKLRNDVLSMMDGVKRHLRKT